MSDRPKSPSPKTAPCLHGAERKNDVKNEPEDNSEPVHEAVNDASLAQDAQDPQVSSSMNDENIPQNAAPVHQEGVLQLESPWFVISVWTEIFRNLTAFAAANQAAVAAIFAPPPVAVPVALNPIPRREPLLPVPASAHINNQRCIRRSNIPLCQFLLNLLRSGDHKDIIHWTNGKEFKLIDPEAVATLWGELNGNATMNYEKMSRGLRYYYGKGIIEKVTGDKYAYRFVNIPENTESSSTRSQK